MSDSEDLRTSDLEDLRTAITDWIGNREATLKAMEKLAEEMKQEGEKFKTLKLGGAVAGATFATLEAVGRQGGVASAANKANLVAGRAAEAWEARTMSSLLEKAMSSIDQEIVKYKMVMETLSQFNGIVKEKNDLQDNSDIAEATRKIDKVVEEQIATAAAAGSDSMMKLIKMLIKTGGHIIKNKVKEAQPMISVVLAALLIAYDVYDATQDTLEEKFLREKMEEMRMEATEIIDGIFNVFAKEFEETPIDNPF